MSIQEIWSNFKRHTHESEVPLVILVVFVAVSSFFLGRLSNQDNMAENNAQSGAVVIPTSEPAVLGAQPATTATSTVTAQGVGATTQLQGNYVGSKNSDKYHLPWCPGAERIKDENRVWFNTKEEAELAGYTPASNCKGI